MTGSARARVILASTLLFSAGYLLMSVMGAYWQFLFLYGVVVGIGVGGTTAPVFGAVLSKWFDRWRGLAISMGLAGVSLGQFALVPPFSAFMLGNGWRLTLLLIALVTVAVNVPLVLFVIRGDPEALGVEPFGAASAAGPADVEQGVWADRPAAGVEQTAAPSVVGATRPACSGTVSAGGDLSLRQAVATRSFWLFTAAMFGAGRSGDFLLTTHLAAMATDHGYSPATGAGLLAWFGLMSMVGLLLAGPASDLVGNKIPMAAAFAIRVVVFALILRSQNLASFYVLALGFGLTFLVTAPLTPTLSGRLYGFAAVGAIGGARHHLPPHRRRNVRVSGRGGLRPHRGLQHRLRRRPRRVRHRSGVHALDPRGAPRGPGHCPGVRARGAGRRGQLTHVVEVFSGFDRATGRCPRRAGPAVALLHAGRTREPAWTSSSTQKGLAHDLRSDLTGVERAAAPEVGDPELGRAEEQRVHLVEVRAGPLVQAPEGNAVVSGGRGWRPSTTASIASSSHMTESHTRPP